MKMRTTSTMVASQNCLRPAISSSGSCRPCHDLDSCDEDTCCHHTPMAENPMENQASSHSKLPAVTVDGFDCNICLGLSSEPVVTMCGHLFCWPCLYRWLSVYSEAKDCPVCRESVQGKIIPLYGNGKKGNAEKMVFDLDCPCRPSISRSNMSHLAIHNRAARSLQNDTHYPQIHTHGAGHMVLYASFCFICSLVGLRAEEYDESSTVGRNLILAGRRRRSNEDEYVVHCVFIMLAVIVFAFFMAC